MPRANWVALAHELVDAIRAAPRDQSVTLSLDELLTWSGADVEPQGFRTRSMWSSCQRGDPDWRTFRDAGLVLNFEPDRTGEAVERVTFRLDRSRD